MSGQGPGKWKGFAARPSPKPQSLVTGEITVSLNGIGWPVDIALSRVNDPRDTCSPTNSGAPLRHRRDANCRAFQRRCGRRMLPDR